MNLTSLFANFTRTTTSHRRRRVRTSKALSSESLEQRALLTVAATFTAATGVLEVVGDDADNTIEIGADTTGIIGVTGVTIAGDVPTLANLTQIIAMGQGGNDTIMLNETNGVLPASMLRGGSGNDVIYGSSNDDTLRGGSGADELVGNRGNDFILGLGGEDKIVWNNGDGSDFMEGGGGNDLVQVNGADAAGDDFSINPDSDRVEFKRNNLGLFTLDIGTTETLNVNGQGGDDIITGSVGLADLISLDLNGGEGNDQLFGGDGIDTLFGGEGNDILIGNKGNDAIYGDGGDDQTVWNNGDGSDLMEGGAGDDTVRVNGADAAGDHFLVTRNNQDRDRSILRRTNLGQFALDIGTTESLDINSQGGSDRVRIKDVSQVPYLEYVNVWAGDGSDYVNARGLGKSVNFMASGGDGDDVIYGSRGDDVLNGDAGNDRMFGLAGADSIYGGTGNDRLFGGAGRDFLDGGDGFDWLNGGGGRDEAANGERLFRI